jgi:hypothetical protein
VGGFQGVALAQGHAAFDDVLQLSHVAGVVIGLEQRQEIGRAHV